MSSELTLIFTSEEEKNSAKFYLQKIGFASNGRYLKVLLLIQKLQIGPENQKYSYIL